MVGSKGERIIRAMKLMRKSTVKKTTGPNCGQKASVTCFCRTLSKRSLATFFLFATLRYLHAIRSSLQALQRTNPEANHKENCHESSAAKAKRCAAISKDAENNTQLPSARYDWSKPSEVCGTWSS